jgi:hypothetical protein
MSWREIIILIAIAGLCFVIYKLGGKLLDFIQDLQRNRNRR